MRGPPGGGGWKSIGKGERGEKAGGELVGCFTVEGRSRMCPGCDREGAHWAPPTAAAYARSASMRAMSRVAGTPAAGAAAPLRAPAGRAAPAPGAAGWAGGSAAPRGPQRGCPEGRAAGAATPSRRQAGSVQMRCSRSPRGCACAGRRRGRRHISARQLSSSAAMHLVQQRVGPAGRHVHARQLRGWRRRPLRRRELGRQAAA